MESIGFKPGADTKGPKIVPLKLYLCEPGKDDTPIACFNLSDKQELQKACEKRYKITENLEFCLMLEVQINQQVSCLRYVQKTTRMGIPDTFKHVIGSRMASDKPCIFELSRKQAPSGMLFRGDYSVHCILTDDESKDPHFDFKWKMEVVK